MDNTFDELLDGDPFEHFIKILQNASPKAVADVLSTFFEEYTLINLALENNNIKLNDLISNKHKYKDEINQGKIDLSINLMSSILSKE